MRWPLLAMGLLIAAPAATRADGIRCDPATSPLERIVCDDKNLRTADEAVESASRASQARLSPDGAALLRRDQDDWRRHTEAVCTTGDDPARCLAAAYRDRAAALADNPVRKGPFLFQRRDLSYLTEPAAEADDPERRRGDHQWSFPRIDQPVTPITRRWNDLIAAAAARHAGSPTDRTSKTLLTYTIGLTNDRLISIDWSAEYEGYGAAHGNALVWTDTMMLRPAPRPLRPADLFRPTGLGRLTALLLAAVREAMPANDFPLYGKPEKFVNQAAIDPKRWSLSENGLDFLFNSYELGPYAFPPPDIGFTWDELKPILAANAPIR